MLTLHNSEMMTHMPFLTLDQEGREVLLFCQAGTDRIWKAYFRTPDGDVRRLPTALPADICECAPTAWHDATGWHVTLIAGGKADDPLFRLYRFDGPALDRLSPPMAIQAARSGHIYKDRIVHGEPENLVHVRRPLGGLGGMGGGGDKVIELPGAFIYCVTYRADEPDKLLVSGQWQQEEGEGGIFTVEYDLATDVQRLVTCDDGKPAYKCTILGETVLYADRIGAKFEDRRIVHAKSTRGTKSQIAIARLPGQVTASSTVAVKGCNCKKPASTTEIPTTRPSCLECVEKHLGAAYVLLSESQDGYAYRLRAVGHLHEAEDESQQWPELHKAVRTARKAYQTQGTIPDWQTLENQMTEARKGGSNAE
ncbi:MAG: hypothetical protein FWD61_00435 [Phycisphaerales bacterium]|nr:hypothetical protein [Phycisphaerales bacterium]